MLQVLCKKLSVRINSRVLTWFLRLQILNFQNVFYLLNCLESFYCFHSKRYQFQVSPEDKLPQKICDGCSYKLDVVNDFRSTTINAEKQLLAWLSEASGTAVAAAAAVAVSLRNTESDTSHHVKPSETFVKEEAIDPSDVSKEEDDDKSYMFDNKFDEVSRFSLNILGIRIISCTMLNDLIFNSSRNKGLLFFYCFQ